MLIELYQVIPTLWMTSRMRRKEIQYAKTKIRNGIDKKPCNKNKTNEMVVLIQRQRRSVKSLWSRFSWSGTVNYLKWIKFPLNWFLRLTLVYWPHICVFRVDRKNHKILFKRILVQLRWLLLASYQQPIMGNHSKI